MVCSQQASGEFLWSLPLFPCDSLRRRTPGPPPFSSMNSTPAASKARLMASSLAAVSDVPFSATSTRPFLTLFVGVFAEGNARAAAVLIDEFDAGQLQGP